MPKYQKPGPDCRLIGVEEGLGNIRPERAVAELLKEALALDYTPTLDRAHRSLQPRPKDGDAPRPIIVKFHYFQEKVDILRKVPSPTKASVSTST